MGDQNKGLPQLTPILNVSLNSRNSVPHSALLWMEGGEPDQLSHKVLANLHYSSLKSKAENSWSFTCGGSSSCHIYHIIISTLLPSETTVLGSFYDLLDQHRHGSDTPSLPPVVYTLL